MYSHVIQNIADINISPVIQSRAPNFLPSPCYVNITAISVIQNLSFLSSFSVCYCQTYSFQSAVAEVPICKVMHIAEMFAAQGCKLHTE
jgi:hypothetical protein